MQFTTLDSEKTLSEASDDVKFGGVVFEPQGFFMRTVEFIDPPNLNIPASVRNRNYMACALHHRVAIGGVGRSVGRISFLSKKGAALLSGWISQSGNNHYFISSSHGYVHDNTVTNAIVCFALRWEGEAPAPNEPPTVFTVQFESYLAAADLLVWKFSANDTANLPPPLSFSRPPVVNDYAVAAGYCLTPTVEKLLEYYNALNDPIKAHAPPPDLDAAMQIFHPHSKVAAPGKITIEQDFGGFTLLAFEASLYHGMSGGPVILVDQQNVLGVCAQVIGNTHTLTLNSNTCLNITKGPTHAYLQQYMQ